MEDELGAGGLVGGAPAGERAPADLPTQRRRAPLKRTRAV